MEYLSAVARVMFNTVLLFMFVHTAKKCLYNKCLEHIFSNGGCSV